MNICPKCNIELTTSSLRSYRLGYINLSSFVVHYWFLRNLPSYISIVLNKPTKEALKIAYHKSYILLKKSNSIHSITGADALYLLLKKLSSKESQDKGEYLYRNRVKILNFFAQTKTKVEWMVLRYLPVLPPNIRPIVKIQGKTIVTTDLNFSYANIINTNSKILKLRKMLVPEKFLSNEKLFLQQKVDILIAASEKSGNISKNNNLSLILIYNALLNIEKINFMRIFKSF